MRRITGVAIAAALLTSACGSITFTSESAFEPAVGPSATDLPSSSPGGPATALAPQVLPRETSVAVERLVPVDSAQGTPSYLAEPTPVVAPAPPIAITPLIVSQSAEVKSATAPAPVAEPVRIVPPVAQAPVITTPPVTAPPATTPPIAAPPAASPPLVSTGLQIDWASATKFVSDINGLRAGRGLAALTRSAELDSLALGWAQTMAADGNMRHSSIIHSLVNLGTWTGAAENIGYGSTETIVFEALVNSPSHLVNMVNPAYTHVGTAAVVAGNLVWTAHLFVG